MKQQKHTAKINSLLQAIIRTMRVLFLSPNRPIRPTRLRLGVVGASIVPSTNSHIQEQS